MTRIVFLSALTALVGCKKDDCDDTAAGACDTGATEEVEEEEEEEEEAGDPAPTGDSCSFGDTVCIAAGVPDNEAWCTGLTGTYSADSCPTGYDGSCAIPGGEGDYTADATAYYYDNSDPETACTGSGGTYTPASGS